MKTCVLLVVVLVAACSAFPGPAFGPPQPGADPRAPMGAAPAAPVRDGKPQPTGDLKTDETVYLASPYSALPYSTYNLHGIPYGSAYSAYNYPLALPAALPALPAQTYYY